METMQEIEERKQGRPKKVEFNPPKFDYDKYYEDASYIESHVDPKTREKTQQRVKKELLKMEYQRLPERQKCKIRCAKAFDVPVEVLDKAYIELNGKKIDGIFANDFFDRYGFSNGVKLNRHQVVEKWKLSSIHHFEVAEKNLIEILKSEDIIKAYNNYMKKYLIEKEKKEFEGQVNI